LHFSFDTFRDLPDMEQLEEAGLLSKQKLLGGALPGDLSETHDLINREEQAQEDLDAEESPRTLSAEDLHSTIAFVDPRPAVQSCNCLAASP